jgi:hypothetical protein
MSTDVWVVEGGDHMMRATVALFANEEDAARYSSDLAVANEGLTYSHRRMAVFSGDDVPTVMVPVYRMPQITGPNGEQWYSAPHVLTYVTVDEYRATR